MSYKVLRDGLVWFKIFSFGTLRDSRLLSILSRCYSSSISASSGDSVCLTGSEDLTGVDSTLTGVYSTLTGVYSNFTFGIYFCYTGTNFLYPY